MAADSTPTEAAAPFNGSYCNICNPFEYQSNYPTVVADHMRDITDLFHGSCQWHASGGLLREAGRHHGRTPGIVPNGASSRRLPGTSSSSRRATGSCGATTAILVTVDEGGGYYDSGFIQPVDFFGTGPRIPMIAVSPFSTGGHISHVYNEHSSFVKFIERNWQLSGTLSERSRDNLPNPVQDDDNTYVPRNMPAIGDLFDLFRFGHEGGGG